MRSEQEIMEEIVRLQCLSTFKDGKTDVLSEAKKTFFISALLYTLGKLEKLEI